jgi:hypothetical protein
MSEPPRNIVASIHDRLTNEARKSGKPFGEVLQYYGMERFLYRFSQTQYSDNFILKGGLIFYGRGIPLRRPTRDIDFLSLLTYALIGVISFRNRSPSASSVVSRS